MTIDSPLGPLHAAATELGVCRLGFDAAAHEVAEVLPAAAAHLEMLRRELAGYFGGGLTRFTVPVDAHGTAFQAAVWEELRRIPYGETRSYAQVARAIGRPSAVRAVARANATNPVAILVPCHRVIGSDGSLTGYGGGLWRKQRLLEIEGAMDSRRAHALFTARADSGGVMGRLRACTG
jgi:AraC family transcriptional regulator of adaptative response/methylated-DNA-[protein]-cysteine methyltransferase